MNRLRPLYSALLNRLRTNLALKLFLLLTLPTVATAAYLATQRIILFPTRSIPLTWFDHVIPFEPRWVWVYLSLYLLNPLGPLFTRSRQDLLRYTRGILFLFVSGLTCFVLFPVAGPRPVLVEGYWLYNRLTSLDRPFNSFPSLHAACAAYAVLFAAHASADSSRPNLRKFLLCCAWIWVGLILYSTVATRQHFALDLPPGLCIAWLAQRLFLNRRASEIKCQQKVLIAGRTLMVQFGHPDCTSTAPPARDFPEWPAGWYVLGQSHQLKQEPIGVELWGRRLVCFRSAQGCPVVMDANCWHMGADLSRGAVAGGQIVCPFHGWRYGASGICEHVPSQTEIPACARQQTYCATEFLGLIFVFPSAQSEYPLPFFAGTQPADLVAAPRFEFLIDCPWWLVGTNGFDLQHFAGLHNRRLLGQPIIEQTHPASRRIVATFEVCGQDWRDRLTRRFAGHRVTMDVTVWSGTLVFVMAHFHNSLLWDGRVRGTTSYGMTEICPVSSSSGMKSRVRVTIFRRRRFGLGMLDWLDVRIKQYFVHAFLKPDTLLLDGAIYDPNHLIGADQQMSEYLHWLVVASRNHSIS